MPNLEVTLFGSPRLSIEGSMVNSRVDKAIALIATLALCGPSLNRDSLIAYLWTNSEISKAHGALRTALWRLRSAGLDPWLEIERDQVTLHLNEDFWLDVLEFQKCLEQAQQHNHPTTEACPVCFPLLTRAVDLYKGDFMCGYNLRNAAGFDEWRTQYNQVLHNDYLTSLERLVKGLYKHANFDQAIHIGRRWLAVDPYNENAHSLFLKIYASNGERANAIAHYRSYKRLVEKNLNIPPSEEITNFYQHLLYGKNPSTKPIIKLTIPVILQLDLEQVTNLWAKHGNLMGQVINHLSHLIKDQTRRFGGRIIQNSGDSHTILFERGQPLYFAIAVFRQIGLTKLGLPGQLQVRMALTTISSPQSGLPEYATDIFLCSQLLQAASGRQILLTSQVMHEIELPVGARTHDLGRYSLPGQTNPVQVFELIHPHLPNTERSFLHSLTKTPYNLPVQTTRFVGRESELVELSELLAQPECRLLTLVGPGGVGKTRLAIQTLSQIQSGFPDGIYVVSLVAHPNSDSIYRPIAEALKISFNNVVDQSDQLIQYLGNKRILLLLDNLEHLLQSGQFIVKILDSAPGVKLMVTSRERLNLYSETIFEVRGLPYPAQPDSLDLEQYGAIKLFVQNARRILPGYLLRPNDKPAVIRICSLVDGLPLGIELASSWVRAYSCQEIADSIQDNLDFVRTTSQDVPIRHRSLRAAFDHSWILISEESRRMLVRLSIYRDGFSLQAAQYMHAVPIMLADYIDKSLLTRQSSGRYYMPETIRVYAEEKFKQDTQEYSRTINTYCDYYRDFLIKKVQGISTKAGPIIIDEIHTEYKNILVALTQALDYGNWQDLSKSLYPLFSYLSMLGNFREERDIALSLRNRLVELVGMQQPNLYFTLMRWEGWATFHLGFHQEGLEKLQASLEYTQEQGLIADEATTLLFLAEAHRRLGDLTKAFQEIQLCLNLMEKLVGPAIPHPKRLSGHVMVVYASILLNLKRVEEARQILTDCLEVLDQSESHYGFVHLFEVQAQLAVIDQKYEESRQLRLQALEIAQKFGDWRESALILNNLSQSEVPLGNIQAAISYITEAEKICDEMGERQMAAICNNNLGYYTLTFNKNPTEAILYYTKALALFRELSNLRGIFFTLRDISRAYLLDCNTTPARTNLIEALEVGRQLGDPGLAIHLLPVLARFLAQSDQLSRAIQLCKITIEQSIIEQDLRDEASEFWLNSKMN
jgi:predicted ATPase/DNA-binding SARP family transcriptional activator